MWYKNSITDSLNIAYPIMQGPFGGRLSSPELVAAVSNAGGLGGYGAYTLSPNEIVEVDTKIKSLTDKPYNLNLWVSDSDTPEGGITSQQYEEAKTLFAPYYEELGLAFPEMPAPFKSRFENQLQTILDIRPKVFSFVFGTLEPGAIEEAHKKGITLVGAATTLDEAVHLENSGVDMIIASGFEAGGHRPSFLEKSEASTVGTFVLLQLIKEKVKVPVVAAGGIANGKGIAAAFMLGADAVQVGTAFLACDESGALPVHRDSLFSEAARHTILTRAFTGRLGRGLRNRLAQDLVGREASLLPFPLQTTFSSPLRSAGLDQHRYDMILFWCGQIAPILKHRKAEILMKSLIKETSKIMESR